MKSRSLVKACAGFVAVVSLAACMRGAKSKVNADEPAAKPRFDINDVSILMKRPSKETRDQYLRLGSKASEGPFLTKEQFDKAAAMLSRTNLLPYEQWALSAVRIDNCGKLFPSDSCQPQIRLVFQPLWTGAEFSSNVNFEPSWKSTNFFGDAAIHLAYDITDAGESMQMYQDFLTLKMKNSQVSSDGMLGEHPILASQGMQGEFAKTLHTLVLKYSRVSKLERIAIMGADVVGGSAVWEFAATTNIKNGKFEQSPIPCQDLTDKTSIFETIANPLATSGGMKATKSKGCPETEIDNLINFNLANPDPARVFAGDNPETKRAFRIDNPEVTSFASASCVACHKASRKTGSLSTENALDGTSEYSRIRAKSPQAFKIPSGVSTTKAKDESSFSGGAWAIRAFGWGETGTDPDISGYTLNDSMRVASELNELIRQGKLK